MLMDLTCRLRLMVSSCWSGTRVVWVRQRCMKKSRVRSLACEPWRLLDRGMSLSRSVAWGMPTGTHRQLLVRMGP